MNEHDMLMIAIGVLNAIGISLVAFSLKKSIDNGEAIKAMRDVLDVRVERADREHAQFATKAEVEALRQRVEHIDACFDRLNDRLDEVLREVRK